MEFLGQLWLPIVVSAVLVFIMSAIVHTVFQYHNREWSAAPNQDALQAAIKGAAPGLYNFPRPEDPKAAMSPEAMAKWAAGPSAMMTVFRPGPMSMPKMLGQSLALNLAVSFFAAYVAAHALAMGVDAAPYLTVFRVVGTIGFMAYAFGKAYDSIWFGMPWKSYGYVVFDSLLYGLLMGGAFGWLWPRG